MVNLCILCSLAVFSAVHQAARSTISLAEDRFSNPNHHNHREFDPAWQEMLNHATKKVGTVFNIEVFQIKFS